MVGEFAHADGEVDRRATLGDFHLAPGTVGVEEHEQIGGSVAPVLAVVALDLPRLGRDRPAHLADELDRALVEADHGPLRVRRLGVEIEHVLHAGDVVGVDLRDAPHLPAPRLEIVVGQAPTHRLARQTLVRSQLDHLAGEQVERPSGAARRRVCAGGRHQQRLLLAGQLAFGAGARLLAQRPLQIALHEPPFGPVHRRAADADAARAGSCFIATSRIAWGRSRHSFSSIATLTW